MGVLVIDEKWSIEYEGQNNDRPVRVLRYNEISPLSSSIDNLHVALFYALLEARRG